ncbi:MAG: hypothetical protein M1142_02985 [Patescibacteria group bacterium]|nr:hypothetical protein [Patescibacteria group bacterium]
MHWQDLIITFGQVIFSVALLPMVFSKDKPVLITSLITGLVLMIYAWTYITIQFWFGAAMTAVTGVIWLLLAWQKHRLEKK